LPIRSANMVAPSRDFDEYLKSQVAACDAMLAIIGPNWLTAKDEAGQRRLSRSPSWLP